MQALDRLAVALGVLVVAATALLDLDDVYPLLAPALCLVCIVVLFGVSTYLQFGRYHEYETLVELVENDHSAFPPKAHLNYRWELALVRWALDEKTQAWVRREGLARAARKQGARANRSSRPRI